MAVTYSHIAKRLKDAFSREGIRMSEEDLKVFCKLFTQEISEALSKGEDVYLEGFGRFYPAFKPSKRLKSGITQKEHLIEKRVVIKFKPFERLNTKAQEFLRAMGLTGGKDADISK